MTAESPTRTRWTGTLLLTAILFVLVSMLSMVPFVRELGLRLSDSVYRVAPQPAKPSKVVLILIDDQSLQAYGRWPWSRTLLAQLTRNLNQAGAQAVGIDILLSEAQSADADLPLARAIKDSGAVIVDKIGTYPDGPRWIEPLAQFAHSAGAVGHAQAVLDRDGVCRRFPVQELTADGARFAFAFEVARRVDKNAADQFLEKNGISAIDDNSPLTWVKPTLVTIPFRRSGI